MTRTHHYNQAAKHTRVPSTKAPPPTPCVCMQCIHRTYDETYGKDKYKDKDKYKYKYKDKDKDKDTDTDKDKDKDKDLQWT